MYDELVKRLWECASGECFNCSQYTPTTNASICQKELMKQAANVIKELSKKKDCPCWFEDGGFCSMLGKCVAEPPKEEET